MYVVIGIGVLLLGGVSGLPSADRPLGGQTDEFGVPIPDVFRREPPPGVPGGALPPSQYPRAPSRTGRAGTEQTTREPYFPLSPTDPALGASDSPWPLPTDSGATAAPSFGSRPMVPGGYGRPGARSAGSAMSRGRMPQRSATARSASELAVQQAQAARLQGLAGGNAGTQVTKPFANYAPSSTISPYLNMFRRDTGGVDNYSTYVRPLVEQQRSNQVIGGQIRGLQSSTRVQTHVLERLGKRTQTLGGTNVPEYFMNHGSFYSGMSR